MRILTTDETEHVAGGLLIPRSAPGQDAPGGGVVLGEVYPLPPQPPLQYGPEATCNPITILLDS
jgi:hypothetical protein